MICDYNCMWNGVEDQYMWKTDTKIPKYLFFGLSAFCSVIYLKQSKPTNRRVVYWSNGLPQRMYNFMEEVIGYTVKKYRGKDFEKALASVKRYIDNDIPVTLGALDMYNLPYYEKFFHKNHIPIHYVLAVGYNDSIGVLKIADCGKNEYQEISYSNLQSSWNVDVPGFSKAYTYYVFNFKKAVRPIEEIFKIGLKKKCVQNLESEVSFIGINGIKKIAKEFPKWQNELSHESYIASLKHFVEYTGFPPALPFELTGDCDSSLATHKASRDVFADLLNYGCEAYCKKAWGSAAALFNFSGEIIEQMTDLIVKKIQGSSQSLTEIPEMLDKIALLEGNAYHLINKSIEISYSNIWGCTR